MASENVTPSVVNTYSVDGTGTIFVSAVTNFLDASGNIMASSLPNRVVWPPGTIAATNPDPKLVSMAAIFHTPAVIAAYQAQIAAQAAAK